MKNKNHLKIKTMRNNQKKMLKHQRVVKMRINTQIGGMLMIKKKRKK